MEALLASRGFEVQHQRVILDIDFDSQTINASSFLTVLPLNPSLRTIFLNASPELDIHRVSISSPTIIDPFFDTPASYTLSEPFSYSPGDVGEHPAIKRKTWAAIDEADGGDLAISVSGGWIRLVEGEGRLAPLEIRIDYRLVQGVHFDDDQVYNTGAWVPCVDSLWARCTWELIYIVPRGVTVASSGELLEQVAHPHSSTKTIFSHLQTIPTTVRHIGFLATTAEIQAVDDRIVVFGGTTDFDFVSRAMLFYTTEFGTYPYQDFKIAFVHDLPAVTVYACMVLLPYELACDNSIIEASIELRETLTLALARQWIGINIIPREASDTWIVNGLALHIRALCLRNIFGNNDYRYRLKKDIDRCVRLDQGSKAPICVPGSTTLDVDFVNLKAPLVLHVLDRHLLNTGPGLARIIPRIFLSALSDELGHGNSLSTAQFFRICRKVTNLDLTQFADQWVFGSKCPHFKINANFIRKKFLVELTVQVQVQGSLTVRIHEADGAPFEHIIDIKQPSKTFNLPFNTKYKRTRRSGKVAARFEHLQDEAEELPAELFSYPPWDNEDIRREWKVGEWSEDQANAMVGEGGGYEWIRIDPECEWLAWFEFPERPWYWISQLQGDRDVAAQIQSIQNLTTHLSPVVASELAKVALVRNYYYRVRMEAVRALVMFNCPEADLMGSFLLLKLYQHFKQARNDFSDMPEYFVANAVYCALGDLRVPDAKMALIEALQSNDNSRNAFDDSYRLATIVAALGNCAGDHHRRETNDIVDRLLTMDRLVPSYRNIVTQSGLLAILQGQRLNDPRPFLSYTREGSIMAVREVALGCLLMCRPPGRSQIITDYVLTLVRLDSTMRSQAACALSEAILVSLSLGEIMMESGDDLAIVKTLRRELSKRSGLREGIQDVLCTHYAELDDSARLALIKVAEIAFKGHSETITPAQPEAPKIRLSLSSNEVPTIQPKITLKKIPTAQKLGLADADLLAISNALKKLKSHKSSWYFLHPVDPIRDQVPDYPLIVKSPMDLSTIGAKLDSGTYRSRSEFVDDIRLIISNCMLYNRSDSPIHAAAKTFEAYFNDLWIKTENTLSFAPRGDNAPREALPQIPAPAPVRVPAPAPARPPTSAAPTIRLSAPQPVIRLPAPALLAPAPTIKLKAPGPVMAPPPVPVKKIKRPSAVDDMLGQEIDAIERKPVEVKKPKVVLKSKDVEVPLKQRRAKGLIATLKQDPNAYIFSQPVDPIRDGCPTYLDEIQEPMDLGTISNKIDGKRYKNMSQLAHDIELVFANCRTFNKEGPIVDLANNLEAVYRKEWPRVISPKLNVDEKKALAALLAKSFKEKSSLFFREAVDPIKQNIPQYFDIIPQEDARDLSLIKRKLGDGSYSTARQVDDAVELMLENARVFNGDGPVVQQANEFGNWWRAQRSKMD